MDREAVIEEKKKLEDSRTEENVDTESRSTRRRSVSPKESNKEARMKPAANCSIL